MPLDKSNKILAKQSPEQYNLSEYNIYHVTWKNNIHSKNLDRYGWYESISIIVVAKNELEAQQIAKD